MSSNMKMKIAEVVYQLMQKKTIDKITVKDVSDKCGISRPTFYYHFQDIYSVVDWTIQQKVDQLVKQSSKAQTHEEAIRLFVRFCIEDRKMVNRLLQSQQRQAIEKAVVEGIQQYLISTLLENETANQLSLEEGKMVVEFCSYGIVGICMKHCNDKDVDEDALVKKLVKITKEFDEKLNK